MPFPFIAIAGVAAVSAVAGFAAGAWKSMRSKMKSRPARPNPIVEELESRAQAAEERAKKAEAANKANAWEEEANRAEERAIEVERKAKASEERANKELEKRVKAAEDRATKAESDNKAKASEEIAAKVKLENKAKWAEERAHMAETSYQAAMKTAKDQLDQAKREQAEAERKLKEGIQPTVVPTKEEIESAKKARGFHPANVHYAIAGISGSGKSSLINAFRGLANNDLRQHLVARTGDNETTMKIGRYPQSDVEPGSTIVWYDIPGAGTLSIPDWQYFNSQGLFIFDAIIVLFDNRFTQTDIAILRNCKDFNIPTYIVRSKSEVHIDNIMKNMPGYPDDDDDDDDGNLRAKFLPAATHQYVSDSRKSVANNLEQAKLNQQDVYLVSKGILLSVIKEKQIGKRKVPLDENKLLNALFKETTSRRF